jgi:uncharacterized protein (DUF2225 family)|tara:strand:- start:499 stop:741 length:243 start_codon:yes stop_codon:yes gene_type:complete
MDKVKEKKYKKEYLNLEKFLDENVPSYTVQHIVKLSIDLPKNGRKQIISILVASMLDGKNQKDAENHYNNICDLVYDING